MTGKTIMTGKPEYSFVTINIKAFYINSDGNRELKEYKNIDETLYLQSVHVSLELKEIYEGSSSPK